MAVVLAGMFVPGCNNTVVFVDDFETKIVPAPKTNDAVKVNISGIEDMEFKLQPSTHTCNKTVYDVKLRETTDKLIKNYMNSYFPNQSDEKYKYQINVSVQDVRADLACISVQSYDVAPCKATASLRVQMSVARDNQISHKRVELGTGSQVGPKSGWCVKSGPAIADALNEALQDAIVGAFKPVTLN